MTLITYVGPSDIRSFGTSDSVGVELEFHRNVAQDVPAETAKFLLEDLQFSGEFIKGEVEIVAPDEPDESIDDSQAALPDLRGGA